MIAPRKVEKPLILYGYGRLGQLAEEIFNELDIPILNVLDQDGYKVEPPNDDILLAICVAAEPYEKVIAPLVAAGWTDIVPVWDIIEAYPEIGIHNGWMASWEETSFAEEDECDTVMSKFSDKLSKIHYERNHLGWRRIHYEDPDVKIMPILSLPSTLSDIRQRQRVDMFADSPMKSISIHNEGCELTTLEMNMYLFQKYRPAIDVACYHSWDGLWKIEKLLMDNLPGYTWTFRLTAWMGQGAYIFGVPNERGEA